VKCCHDAEITIKLLEKPLGKHPLRPVEHEMVGMAKSNFPSLPVFPTAGV